MKIISCLGRASLNQHDAPTSLEAIILIPDFFVDAVQHAPGDFPSGKKGDVLTVLFTVMGILCLGLDPSETDRYWNAIVNNGG